MTEWLIQKASGSAGLWNENILDSIKGLFGVADTGHVNESGKADSCLRLNGLNTPILGTFVYWWFD